MWHGGRAHLTFFNFLLEIVHRDVTPNVPVEIENDVVDTLHRIENGSVVIVMRNLGGVLRTFQPKFFFAKFIGKLLPVDSWIGHKMRIEIAGCTAKFCMAG